MEKKEDFSFFSDFMKLIFSQKFDLFSFFLGS